MEVDWFSFVLGVVATIATLAILLAVSAGD